MEGGQFQDAIGQYDRAIELNPNLAEVYYRRGNAYRLLAMSQRPNEGDGAAVLSYERAIADYDETLRLDPDLSWAYYMRGMPMVD